MRHQGAEKVDKRASCCCCCSDEDSVAAAHRTWGWAMRQGKQSRSNSGDAPRSVACDVTAHAATKTTRCSKDGMVRMMMFVVIAVVVGVVRASYHCCRPQTTQGVRCEGVSFHVTSTLLKFKPGKTALSVCAAIDPTKHSNDIREDHSYIVVEEYKKCKSINNNRMMADQPSSHLVPVCSSRAPRARK